MPPKKCHSDKKTDDVIGAETLCDYQFLGILWNLEDDTLSPKSYLSVERNVRGKREDVLLEQLPDEVIVSLEFKKSNTRRVISRVCAQIYDPLGQMFGILNSSMKIILSRTCGIHPGITQLDQELII